jgi:membrane fusion protein
MGQRNFFRQEVIENIRNKHNGTVCMNTPLPYSSLAIWLMLIVIGIIAFALFAEFSEKFTVNGYLNTDKGVAHIYPTKNGIITTCKVRPGEHVKAGDVLFVIHTTYDNISKELKQNEFKQLKIRKKVIQQEIINKQNHLKNLAELLNKKYIAQNTYQSIKNEISTLENSEHQLKMDMIKYKRALTYTIFAPISGTISNIIYQVGQYVNPAKSMLNILPDNTDLIAKLYVPVSKSGFINPNDKIIIHYNAYPFQRFGVATGQIQNISQTILTDTEESKPIKIGEPYYTIIAKLDKQNITLYGKLRPLQQGMTCSAIIYGAQKKIWQWIFDPLYNFQSGFWK